MSYFIPLEDFAFVWSTFLWWVVSLYRTHLKHTSFVLCGGKRFLFRWIDRRTSRLMNRFNSSFYGFRRNQIHHSKVTWLLLLISKFILLPLQSLRHDKLNFCINIIDFLLQMIFVVLTLTSNLKSSQNDVS